MFQVQKTVLAEELNGLSPRAAYIEAMKTLIAAPDKRLAYPAVKQLLIYAGFSQNGRNRIIHYSKEEWQNLCDACPIDDFLLEYYVIQIQELMGQMDQVRKTELSSGIHKGRPFITQELAHNINQLTVLTWLQVNGFNGLKREKLRILLQLNTYRVSVAGLLDETTWTQERIGKPVPIRSAVRFLEVYRTELLRTPVIERRKLLDLDTQDIIASNDFSWMEDGGVQFLEDIRDVPLFREYDALPDYHHVVDWFIAESPDMDDNQVKRGWAYLNEKSNEWHQQDDQYGYYETIMDECPEWQCVIEEQYESWLKTLQHGIPYKLVPITKPKMLYEETLAMHHCVVTHLENCLSGRTRIFSIRDESGEKRIATVEINYRHGYWEVTEFKGRFNEEFIHHLNNPDDPLSIMMSSVVSWYDKHVPDGLKEIPF